MHVKSFKELFARFLEDTGPSVEWEKIKPPPEGSVRYPYKNDSDNIYIGYKLNVG